MAAGRVSRRGVLTLPASLAIASPGVLRAAAEPARGWADDGFFGRAVIDTDAWRAGPTRHRYIHGRFEGTDTRFVVALPEPSTYRGRFMQFLQGGLGGNELTGYGRGSHELAFSQGAYYVESNQGHIGNDMGGLRGDISVLDWRASAQAARFARTMATAMYGRPPHHGYVTGGSGGGMRSILCLENAPDIWNGAAPFMINRNGLTQFNWSVGAWASVVLQDRLPALARASLEGQDPASVLSTDAEKEALSLLYRTGYPRGAEDQLGPNPLWILGMQMALAADPRYFIDFWREPGYEGRDGAPEIRALTVDLMTEVEAVLTGDEVAAAFAEDPDAEITGAGMRAGFVGKSPAAIRIKGDAPGARLLGSSLQFETGEAKGRRILCTGAVAGALTATLDAKGFGGVRPGDRLTVNNRALLAFLYYHRHHVDARYAGMRPFLDQGRPRHAQGQMDLDTVKVPSGRFRGKMILLQHRHDREALPTSAEPYIQDVRRHLGVKADDAFRIWWMDNAQHGVPADARTRYIDYRGACSQAVADVIRWVEEGKPPPGSTRYQFDDDAQVVTPAKAVERRGVQPTIAFTANGATSTTVKVGQAVRLRARLEAPPGAGRIVSAAFDLKGRGDFAASQAIPRPAPTTLVTERLHAFEAPGRYVVTVRADAERDGRADGFLVQNLARVLVIVI